MYDTAAKDIVEAKTLRGELYGIEGYDELLLADLFCSGVPLSTLDFQKDFTYHASSTTDQAYQDAQAKFDTALTLVPSDSIRLMNLVRVGLGRTLLARGQYGAAAQAVAEVPDAFLYQMPITISDVLHVVNLWNDNIFSSRAKPPDREGGSGLPICCLVAIREHNRS